MIIAVFIISMLAGIGIGLPIAMALLLCAVCTALTMGGGDANPTIIARTLMQGADSVSMMALPFFVLAGEIMNRGGLTKRIIAFCDIFLGRIRGGLGYVTIFACLMFAAMVGSAVAACAALGAILIPMMVNSGYNREQSAALVASANLVAPIMPPSVPMIVFGVSAGVSIKSMFMAGIAPAVYLTVIACVVLKQGKPVITTVMIGLAVALTIYFSFYIFQTLHTPFDTTLTYSYTMWDSVEEKGLLVRDEQVLPGREGILDVIQAEGERVAAGQTLALVYQDSQAQDNQAVMEELRTEIQLLTYAMSRGSAAETSARLDEAILQSIVSLRGSAARQEFSTLEDQVMQIKSGVLKRGSVYGGGASAEMLNTRLQELKDQLATLNRQTAAVTTRIQAEHPGTYSAHVDGLETVLTPQSVLEMTPGELAELMEHPGGDPTPPEGTPAPVGKLISSPRWYFAAVLDQGDVGRLEQGHTVTVRFTGDFSQDVPMRVERISKEEEGRCAVVLSSDRFLANTTPLREQTVELIFREYSGLRLPKKAVHQVTDTVTDEKTGEEQKRSRVGVYVLVAGQAEFKEVEVLVEDQDFCVVKSLGEGRDRLQAGDEVITRAKHLEDGQLLRY